MTLEQDEFQRLVEGLAYLLERYKGDPATLEIILTELKGIYKKVPIYPGIVANCLAKVARQAQIDELKGGEEVAVVLKDASVISGKVAKVSPDGIELTKCRRFPPHEPRERFPISKRNISEIRLLTRRVLEKEWPSLDFKG